MESLTQFRLFPSLFDSEYSLNTSLSELLCGFHASSPLHRIWSSLGAQTPSMSSAPSAPSSYPATIPICGMTWSQGRLNNHKPKVSTEIPWQNLAIRFTSSEALTPDCTREKVYVAQATLKSITAKCLGVGPLQPCFSKPTG